MAGTNINIEIKARSNDAERIREYLLSHGARFVGTDHQRDTYFKVKKGRLKLREGNIENNLIFYQRENESRPKSSHFQLMPVEHPEMLSHILSQTIGVLVVVDKQREIYYIDNVKFHIDKVEGLGSFIEIEAGNVLADLAESELRKQCENYMSELKINSTDLIHHSYSDMLMQVK